MGAEQCNATQPNPGECWTLGLARAPGPLGPWKKDPKPVLEGKKVCDNSRSFSGSCGGLYVAAVMYGPHTNHEYWMYMEAPINENDEGPIALWTARDPEGPWEFKAYVLDGGDDGGWDAGRYSESRVEYFNGMFHIFMTASPHGNPSPDKDVEQIGWAVSKDGIHFEKYKSNPVVSRAMTTPNTEAQAEGHVWFDEAAQLIYVFHTIRWADSNDGFTVGVRNNEDLGVEILSPNKNFDFGMPIVTPSWKLNLNGQETSECNYDRAQNRYCVPLKTVAMSSGTKDVVNPLLGFVVSGKCQPGDGGVSLEIDVYKYANTTQPTDPVASLPLQTTCQYSGTFEVKSESRQYAKDGLYIVTTVRNSRSARLGPLMDVTVDAHYTSEE